MTFRWNLTAAHNTSTWEYFVDGVLFRTFDQGGAQPPSDISHTLTGLPEGNHTILARWNVSNTPMAFYNCVDLTIGSGGTDPGNPGPDPEPGDCAAPAWSASAVYLGGAKVSHEGKSYEAKWWTSGENPVQSGEWGAWKDLGPC